MLIQNWREDSVQGKHKDTSSVPRSFVKNLGVLEYL